MGAVPDLRRLPMSPAQYKSGLGLTICNHKAYLRSPSLAEKNPSKGDLTMGRLQLSAIALVLALATAADAGPPVRIGIAA